MLLGWQGRGQETHCTSAKRCMAHQGRRYVEKQKEGCTHAAACNALFTDDDSLYVQACW
jgi:hypothetical protein